MKLSLMYTLVSQYCNVFVYTLHGGINNTFKCEQIKKDLIKLPYLLKELEQFLSSSETSVNNETS